MLPVVPVPCRVGSTGISPFTSPWWREHQYIGTQVLTLGWPDLWRGEWESKRVREGLHAHASAAQGQGSAGAASSECPTSVKRRGGGAGRQVKQVRSMNGHATCYMKASYSISASAGSSRYLSKYLMMLVLWPCLPTNPMEAWRRV